MNRSFVLVTIDGLGASYLGPYGNAYIPTPGVNRFAAEARVFDQALSDSPSPAAMTRSVLRGRHAADDRPSVAGEDLAEELRSIGVRTIVVSDSPEFLDLAEFAAFDERLAAESPAARRAERIEQTQLFSVVATGIAVLENLAEPAFVWIHAKGMNAAWDAPLELREAFHDEDDPPPSDLLDAPGRADARGMDPDELFPISMAYAGQVSLVDVCWELMTQSMSEAGFMDDSIVVLTSPRGCPLGDHGTIGTALCGLHSDSVRVPLIVSAPIDEWGGSRSATFVQPPDLHCTLREWFGLPTATVPPFGDARSLLRESTTVGIDRDRAVCVSESQQSLRTPCWYLIADSQPPSLFVKPDDLWEVNDVADKCPDITNSMLEVLATELQRIATGATDRPLSLDPLLLTGLD